MSYIDDSLVPGEEILYRAKPSIAAFIFPVLLLIFFIFISNKIHELLTLFVILFSLVVLFRLFLVYKTTEFALTNKRIIAKTGFIRRRSIEIMLSKVESISVTQRIDGRIFNFGTVIVVGSGGTNQYFPIISKPMLLRKTVNVQLSKFNDPGYTH